MDAYPLVPIHKEECLAHVSKRIKKNLCKIKKNTKAHTYIQHRLTEPKADYVSSNYSTVILQTRGKTPALMAKALDIIISHTSGNHETCPEDSWCRWTTTGDSQTIPARSTNFTSIDIDKVREVFSIFASEEFCGHLTLGMTQNANESLHNTIWNFCPKAKYVSPQSIRISTAIAVVFFNDTELSLYGLLSDLNLNPSYIGFKSIMRREAKRKQDRKANVKSNILRRARRQTQIREKRDIGLLKAEGGRSYKSGSFGSERTMKRPKFTKKTTGKATSRGKGVKRPSKPTDTSETYSCDSSGSEPTRRPTKIQKETRRSPSKRTINRPQRLAEAFELSLSDTNSSTAGEDTLVCNICESRHPPHQIRRAIYGKGKSQWIKCVNCENRTHLCCTEHTEDEISSLQYRCIHCKL